MEKIPQRPAAMRRQTNSFAVAALALALIPSLTASVVLIIIRSSDYEMFDALVRYGGSNFVANCQLWAIPALLTAVIAAFRRPGRLSNIALAVSFANLFFSAWLFAKTPHSLK